MTIVFYSPRIFYLLDALLFIISAPVFASPPTSTPVEKLQHLVDQKEKELMTAVQYAQAAFKKGKECFSQKDYKNAFAWH